LSLAAAVLPRPTLAPAMLMGGGAASVALFRRRAERAAPARMQLLSRVSITPRTQAALLSVDGAGWLVIVGDGCAQLARAELSQQEDAP
jgi:hypothetical protein